MQHSRELAAQALEAPAADLEYRGGRFSVAGTDLGIDLGELAARQDGRRIAVQATTTGRSTFSATPRPVALAPPMEPTW